MLFKEKGKKSGIFFPLPVTATRVVKEPGKKGCRQGRVSENVRVKVSSVHLCVYPTHVHSQQLEEAHASVCLVSQDTESFSLCGCKIVTFDKMNKEKLPSHIFFIDCSLR